MTRCLCAISWLVLKFSRFLVGISFLTVLGHAHAGSIILAKNLATESLQAATEGKIYLLYVSRPECPYCARLEKNVLHPMMKSHEYDSLVMLRELSMEGGCVTDFDGVPKPSGEISRQLKIIGTPTLFFLGAQGAELVPRITGYYSEDFYWHYFDKAIEDATEALSRAEEYR